MGKPRAWWKQDGHNNVWIVVLPGVEPRDWHYVRPAEDWSGLPESELRSRQIAWEMGRGLWTGVA